MNYKKRKILLLDDEKDILNIVERGLRKEGFECIFVSTSFAEAYEKAMTVKPDLCVLDVVLPDGDGFDLMQRIRQTMNIPVIFLTAKDEDYDKLLGLGLGADDYLTKPFLTKELILRITAVLKRTYHETSDTAYPIFNIGNRIIDMEQNLIISDGLEFNITAKERALLLKLYHNHNKVVTNDALCEAVWGDSLFGYEQTLMTHIGRIRKKIEPDPATPQYLITLKGIGYKLII